MFMTEEWLTCVGDIFTARFINENMENEFRTYIPQFLLIWCSPWIESTREARQVEANDRPDAAGQSQNVQMMLT